MTNSNINSDLCPNCGGNEIYSNENLPNRGNRQIISVSSAKWIGVYARVCVNCGYFEEFIPEKELKDEKTMNKLKSTWKKL